MNINNDYIMRMAESFGRFAAKVLLNKEQSEMEDIDWEAVSGQDILPILVKRLVHERKYNEAENIIFDELNRNPSIEIYDIAKNFYNILLSKSDEELERADFPRVEIFMGLEDAGRIISSNSK